MTYPQQGVNYKHTPKFIDRMKADEGVNTTPFKQNDGDVDSRDLAVEILKKTLED